MTAALIGGVIAIALVTLLYLASRGLGPAQHRRSRNEGGGGVYDVHGSGGDGSSEAVSGHGGSFGGGGASGSWDDGHGGDGGGDGGGGGGD